MSRSEPNTALLRRALGDARPPRSVEQRIVAGAMARLAAAPRKSRWHLVAGGAALSATALAGVLFMVSTPTSIDAPAGRPTLPVAIAPTPVITTVAAGHQHRATAAATSYRIGEHQIRVGSKTEMRFVETSPTGVALQLEAGNVRCAVEPLPSGGVFAVQTPRLRVEVVGTLFEVDSDGRCSRVRVSEGRVRVSGAGLDAGVRLLGAGDEVVQCDEEPDAEVASATPPPPAAASRAPQRRIVSAPSGGEVIRAGLASLAAGESRAAVDAFERYLSDHPGGDFAEEALFHLAFSYRRLGEPAAARRVTARFIKQFPNGRRADRLRRALGAEEN